MSGRAIAQSRTELQTHIASLTSFLRPATEAEIEQRLAVLFSSLPAQDKGEFAEHIRLRAYHIALGDVSSHVLDVVVRDTIRGAIAEFDPRFVPTPPQLGRVCRERMADLEGERMRADSRLRYGGVDPLAKFDYTPTAEECDRIDEKLAAFHANMSSGKLSPEKSAASDALADIAARARNRSEQQPA